MNIPVRHTSSIETKTAHHPLVYLNGEIVETQNATLPVTTQAFNYGTGVFEGIRGYISHEGENVNIFRLDEHIRRLLNSASLLLIDDIPTADEIQKSILNLLRLNNARSDCYIRPLAFKQHLLPGSGFGVKLSGVSSGLSINTLNMRSYVKQDGIRCTFSSWRRIADNAIPVRAKITGSYVNSALAIESARLSGFDDAFMLNTHGNLSEATTSNIFIVKENKIITPPVNAHILEGITRATVIILAKERLGLEVEERDILPSEVLMADECFLSGTGVEISPVIQIDHHHLKSINDESTTLSIRNIYQQVVRGEIDNFSSWLTPVY
ncbi:branched-chain amino acid transaminase [Acerihabitans arboris]|uniref:Branched-chain-amino-acid aminotransferase n=1 Tax=Acerihabitans arboris TaxID=2691583 RepID=A0A845SRF0_9GAMM|nr:branched-chain amino acid transaminase [Acerihabitans arboris]NDL65208.1 branched-chain amino acid transaminase [Acerihabitans arboris]